jgi:hypothetical protein
MIPRDSVMQVSGAPLAHSIREQPPVLGRLVCCKMASLRTRRDRCFKCIVEHIAVELEQSSARQALETHRSVVSTDLQGVVQTRSSVGQASTLVQMQLVNASHRRLTILVGWILITLEAMLISGQPRACSVATVGNVKIGPQAYFKEQHSSQSRMQLQQFN